MLPCYPITSSVVHKSTTLTYCMRTTEKCCSTFSTIFASLPINLESNKKIQFLWICILCWFIEYCRVIFSGSVGFKHFCKCIGVQSQVINGIELLKYCNLWQTSKLEIWMTLVMLCVVCNYFCMHCQIFIPAVCIYLIIYVLLF